MGDVDVIFTHKGKKKMNDKLKQHKGVSKANSLIHNPSLVSMGRVAHMSLKDRQALIRMLKKHKKKQLAHSCNVGSACAESLDAKPSSIDSDGDWRNWVTLQDKSNRGSKDIVDNGKTINLQFKGDCSNMFHVLSQPSNSMNKVTKGSGGMEGSNSNFVCNSAGC